MSVRYKESILWLIAQLRILFHHLLILGFFRGFAIWTKSFILCHHFEYAVKDHQTGRFLFIRSRTTDLEVYKKVFKDREYALPFELKPKTIIDLGANTGLAAAFFNSQYPEVKMLCVEPDPDNFAALVRQMAQFNNVSCVNAAVWAYDGKINLIDPGIGSWGMQVSDESNVERCKDLVAALSINSLLKMLPGGHCDLLKVDVEGAEREVFNADTSWMKSVSSMVLELHDRYKPGCSRAVFSAVKDFQGEKWIGENVFFWRE
jgi:FkbM family methyltransferase